MTRRIRVHGQGLGRQGFCGRPIRICYYMCKPFTLKAPHIVTIFRHYMCRFAIHLVVACDDTVVITMEKSRTEGSL